MFFGGCEGNLLQKHFQGSHDTGKVWSRQTSISGNVNDTLRMNDLLSVLAAV